MAASMTFEELYTQHFHSTVEYVKGRFRVSLHDAEDIVEAVFIRLWRLNPELEGMDCPPAVIRYRAKMMAVRYLSRRHPMLSLDIPVIPDSEATLLDIQDLQPFAPTVEDQALMEMELGRVALQVDQWPLVERVILKLSVAGYSYDEIFHHVTRKYGFQGTRRSVDKMLLRMRRQLRDALQVKKVQRRAVRLPPKGAWSMRYAACVVCGTTELRHAANGACVRCYDAKRFRDGKKKAVVPRSAMQWARHYTACVMCGTTTVPHEAKGQCKTCYRQSHPKPCRARRRLVAVYR